MSKEEWMREYVGVLPTSGKEYEEMLLENFNNRNQMCVKLDRQVSELKEENQQLKQRLKNIEPKFKHKEWCWTIQNGKVWNINVHLETNTEHIYTFVYDGKKVIDEDGFEEFDTESGVEWGDKNLFKTKEEAIKKLNKMKGE